MQLSQSKLGLMKVLVADKFEKSGIDGLKALGCEVISEPDLKDESLAARIKETGAPILIVRSTRVTKDMFEGSGLKLIIRAGAGYNTIDVESASGNSIKVANCPGKNAAAVAELAFGLIIACDRRIPDNVAELRGGKWNKKGFSKASGLYGKTLGLVGFGNIGHAMTRIAKAFGMEVLIYSHWHVNDDPEKLGAKRADDLMQVAREADVVSIHTSLNPESKGSINKEFFGAMKPGAIFINTARAEVIDQAALEDAISTKGLRAGLDVFEGEPAGGEGEYSGSLRNNSSIYATHHIGASTDQAQEAVADETVRIVREFMQNGMVPNCVN